MKYLAFLLVAGFLTGSYAMNLKSSSFSQKGKIPADYTCLGTGKSPPLSWGALPEGTKTFALICEDPDAPRGTWDHWILYNIPASVNQIGTGSSVGEEGLNSWNKLGYGGPCPPSGEHRYIFKLYALDTRLEFKEAPHKAGLKEAMRGHVLEETELVGLFQKP